MKEVTLPAEIFNALSGPAGGAVGMLLALAEGESRTPEEIKEAAYKLQGAIMDAFKNASNYPA